VERNIRKGKKNEKERTNGSDEGKKHRGKKTGGTKEKKEKKASHRRHKGKKKKKASRAAAGTTAQSLRRGVVFPSLAMHNISHDDALHTRPKPCLTPWRAFRRAP
jgi:hypothetical protein